MFTGIIQATGDVVAVSPQGGDVRLTVDTARWQRPAPVQPGDSISVNGACLTVVHIDAARLAFDVSNETLAHTTLGELTPGGVVNLEAALRAGDALGGHLVTGHVDAVAPVLAITPESRSHRVQFALPAVLAPFVAPKGSICVDGISLTVNEVTAERFGVNIIPHTWDVTVMRDYEVGRRVNLEADVIARYVGRMLAIGMPPTPGVAPVAGDD